MDFVQRGRPVRDGQNVEPRPLEEGSESGGDGGIVVSKQDEGAVVFHLFDSISDLPAKGGRCVVERPGYWPHAKVFMIVLKTADSATLSNGGGTGVGSPPGFWECRMKLMFKQVVVVGLKTE